MSKLKQKSYYELEETLDCLFKVKNLLNDYRHVIQEDNKILKNTQDEINKIVDILNDRDSKQIS